MGKRRKGLKLFHKINEDAYIQSGINICETYSEFCQIKTFVIYFAIKNVGFVGFYFNNKSKYLIQLVNIVSWEYKFDISFDFRTFKPKIFRWKDLYYSY